MRTKIDTKTSNGLPIVWVASPISIRESEKSELGGWRKIKTKIGSVFKIMKNALDNLLM